MYIVFNKITYYIYKLQDKLCDIMFEVEIS